LFSRILEKEIQEDSLAPGYFFFGEESYLAERLHGVMLGKVHHEA